MPSKSERDDEPESTSEPELASKPEPTIKQTESHIVKSLLRPENEPEIKFRPTNGSEEFLDERILTSNDPFGKKQMKIKVLEVSDENAPRQWKFGDRVKVNKILVTIKHLESSEIEEAEFDIAAIEKELVEKRHYSSTNRWVPTNEIKNGYVTSSRHTSLISDASALDYIVF